MRDHVARYGAVVLVVVGCHASGWIIPHAFAQPAEARLRWASRAFGASLPGGRIYSVAQDPDGFLWVATDGGLARFDGLEFQRWGDRGEPKLPNDNVTSVTAARDGSIWVTFRSGGVSRISSGAVTNFAVQDGVPAGVLLAVIEDRDGAIWVAGANGVARYRHTQWERIGSRHGLPDAFLSRNIRIGPRGTIWIASRSGLYRSTGGDRFELVTTEPIVDVSENAEGEVWVTHGTRAVRRLEPGSTPLLDGQDRIGAGARVLHDSRGNLWVGTRGAGLWKLPARGRVLEPVSTHDGLLGEVVEILFEDREGGIWVGSFGSLIRFFNTQIGMVLTGGPSGQAIRSVESAVDGSVWLATSRGLSKVSSEWEPRRIEEYETEGFRPRSLRADAAGRLVLGGDGKLATIVDGKLSLLDAVSSPEIGVVSALALTGDDVWLCHSGRVSSLTSGKLKDFSDSAQLRGKACTAIHADRRGRVWIGFTDGTLAASDNGSFVVYSASDGLAAGAVHGIVEDDDESGTLWVTTSYGLSRFRSQRFATIDDQRGIPVQNAITILQDTEGHLWLSQRFGLIRVAKSEFDKAVQDATHRIVYDIFDWSDGLLSQPTWFSGSPTAVRARDGTLWFVTANGVAVVDPKRLSDRGKSILVAKVERVFVDNNSVGSVELPATLPAGTSTLQVGYTAVSLAQAAKLRFHYMLEGYDNEWVYAGERRQAFLANIPPGKYVFRVRASIGGAAESEAHWAFAIPAVFYRTWWFYALCAVATTAAFAGAWALRLRSLRKRFELVLEERARIGRELHDTVLQSLTAVALHLEGIASQIASPATIDELRHLRRQVEQYIYEARQSILALRSPKFEPPSLRSVVRESAHDLIPFAAERFQLTVTGRPQPYSDDAEQQILRIAQEAMRNSVRHGEARTIRVELHYRQDSLRLVVADDGRGFEPSEDPAPGPTHLGIVGMRERAKKIGGMFKLTSGVGTGTTVEVVVPRSAQATLPAVKVF
jgi:signal transduction histidine kinase/ligand-binding sensor domain-containing protein